MSPESANDWIRLYELVFQKAHEHKAVNCSLHAFCQVLTVQVSSRALEQCRQGFPPLIELVKKVVVEVACCCWEERVLASRNLNGGQSNLSKILYRAISNGRT